MVESYENARVSGTTISCWGTLSRATRTDRMLVISSAKRQACSTPESVQQLFLDAIARVGASCCSAFIICYSVARTRAKTNIQKTEQEIPK